MIDFLSHRHVKTIDTDEDGVIIAIVPNTDNIVVAKSQGDSYSISTEPLSNIRFCESTPQHPEQENTTPQPEKVGLDAKFQVKPEVFDTLENSKPQDEIIAGLGVTRSTYNNIKRGRQPGLAFVLHLMVMTDTHNVWDIVDVVDPPKKKPTPTKNTEKVIAAPENAPRKVGSLKSEDRLLSAMLKKTPSANPPGEDMPPF